MEHRIELRMPDAIRVFSCEKTEKLLFAALRAGVDLPYGCATGTCGGCKLSLQQGQVHTAWPEAPGNRALRHSSDVLACQTVPNTDCVIDVRALKSGHSGAVLAYFDGVLSRVTPWGDGLYCVDIELDRPLPFLPGQFVLLGVDGIVGYRAYSPSTSNPFATRLQLVIRKSVQGQMTSLLCDPNRVGQSLKVLGPMGHAHVRSGVDGDLAVLTGGSGSAVALSLLDWVNHSGHLLHHRMDLVCGLRTATPSPLLESLSRAALRWKEKLNVTVAVSETDAQLPVTDGIRIERGMAHEVAARCYKLDQWKERAVFVAGPEVMVQASMRTLIKQGQIFPASIRFDNFS